MFAQRLVVVGDAHLGRGSHETASAFLEFLDTVPSLGDGLLVTGDLFEFWFAYDRVIPRHGLPVVAGLAHLARRMPVLLIGGNHDRWAGNFWERELDIAFSPKDATFTVGGRAGVAIHGDGITETHWSARVLHQVLRHDMTVALYRSLHPDLGMWLVDRLSGYLGDRTRTDAEVQASSARQAAWAAARLRADPALSLVVMGHTHRAALVTEGDGRLYLNPGAWFDGYRYATIGPEGAALHQFRRQP